MLAIDAGLALAAAWSRPLTIYWRQGSLLRATFTDLFAPIPSVRIDERFRLSLRLFMMERLWSPPYRFAFTLAIPEFRRCHAITSHRFDRLLKAGQLDKLREIDDVAIEVGHRFFVAQPTTLQTDRPFAALLPNAVNQERINREVAQFSEHTVGIHIRRSDNVRAIAYSPLELFVAAMEREIERHSATTFFVASDSLETKQTLVARFGERILTSLDTTRRDTTSGMQQAVVDLYTLSQTAKILGSFHSTFSTAAGALSGIPVEVIASDADKPAEPPPRDKWI